MLKPEISIIIPSFNGANFLKKYSLPSILRQNFSNWEAIIIIDGSSDNTVDVIRDFSSIDKRFTHINQDKNLGLAAALNQGIKKANGEIIAILEHDDIWMPNKLTKQFLKIKKGAKICTSAAIVFDENKNDFTKINEGNLSCLMIKKTSINLLFPLPEENKKYLGIEDGIITARIKINKQQKNILSADTSHIEEILTIMNSSSNTLSAQKNPHIAARRYHNIINLYSKEKNIPELLSFWKKHLYYNIIVSLFPSFFQQFFFRIVEKIKCFYGKKEISVFQKKYPLKYKKIIEYHSSFVS